MALGWLVGTWGAEVSAVGWLASRGSVMRWVTRVTNAVTRKVETIMNQ